MAAAELSRWSGVFCLKLNKHSDETTWYDETCLASSWGDAHNAFLFDMLRRYNFAGSPKLFVSAHVMRCKVLPLGPIS